MDGEVVHRRVVAVPAPVLAQPGEAREAAGVHGAVPVEQHPRRELVDHQHHQGRRGPRVRDDVVLRPAHQTRGGRREQEGPEGQEGQDREIGQEEPDAPEAEVGHDAETGRRHRRQQGGATEQGIGGLQPDEHGDPQQHGQFGEMYQAAHPGSEQAAEQTDQPQDQGGTEGHDEGEGDQIRPVHPPEDEGLRAAPQHVEHGLDEGQAGEGCQLEQAPGLDPGPAPRTRRQPIASRSLHRRRGLAPDSAPGGSGSGARTGTDQAEASSSPVGRSITSAPPGVPARMPTPVSPVSLRPASHSARSCSSSAEE